MLNIDGEVVTSRPENYGLPVLRLGFRPFFLAAGIFAIVSMLVWMLNYAFSFETNLSPLSPALWHAHEMIFGYTMAVVAGFLLTAIKNWTGEEVLRGTPLALLLMLWLAARLMPLSGLDIPVIVVASTNIAFMLLLTVACLRPVLKVRQYAQVGIISKLFLIVLCDVLFYLGITGMVTEGVQWGLYSALYMIIALIMVMMRRVMPMFIKNGIDGDIELKNRAWLDYASLVLLVVFWICDVFTAYGHLTAVTAAALVVLHTMRLAGWYSHRVWSKPLVWVLVVAYGFIIMGFAFKAMAIYAIVMPSLALHAFTVGGIGLVTIGMMSRVSLGHTGRNVFEPPAMVFWSFAALALGAIVRVLLPLFNMELYVYWVVISQLLWIASFFIFVLLYTPMFLTARVDGRDG